MQIKCNGISKNCLKSHKNGVGSKWKLYRWKLHSLRPPLGELQSPILRNKENHMGINELSPLFFLFFRYIERCLRFHLKGNWLYLGPFVSNRRWYQNMQVFTKTTSSHTITISVSWFRILTTSICFYFLISES